MFRVKLQNNIFNYKVYRRVVFFLRKQQIEENTPLCPFRDFLKSLK